MVDSGALLYLTMLDEQGTEFYHVNLSKETLDEALIMILSNLVHSFRHMVDLKLTSMKYDNYMIFFRQTASFMSAILTSDSPDSEDLVTSFFQKFVDEEILQQFVEYKQLGLNLEREEMDRSIKKIIYNLNFMSEISDLKKDQSRWRI